MIQIEAFNVQVNEARFFMDAAYLIPAGHTRFELSEEFPSIFAEEIL